MKCAQLIHSVTMTAIRICTAGHWKSCAAFRGLPHQHVLYSALLQCQLEVQDSHAMYGPHMQVPLQAWEMLETGWFLCNAEHNA